MKIRIYILFLWVFSAACSDGIKNGLPVFTDLNGNEKSPTISKKTKGLIYFFMVPDCPFSQYYTMAINQVHSVFAYKGYQFYAIVPGTLYSKQEIDSFKSQYQFIPEILLDKKSDFTGKHGVKIVPQVVFTNTSGKVIYRGKIDDQALEPGQKKFIVREYYLLNAIKEFDQGKAITISETKAVGCYLEE